MGHYRSEMGYREEIRTCEKCGIEYLWTEDGGGSLHTKEACLEARLKKLEDSLAAMQKKESR